jgi:SPP1 family predicted phage head-tail adaptor
MAKFPGIGELNRRVTMQRPVQTEDEGGGKTIVWQDVAEVWAKVEPVSSREKFFAGQTMSEVTHRIILRHRTDVRNEMRIRFGENHFSVDSIIDLAGARRFLELLCVEDK